MLYLYIYLIGIPVFALIGYTIAGIDSSTRLNSRSVNVAASFIFALLWPIILVYRLCVRIMFGA